MDTSLFHSLLIYSFTFLIHSSIGQSNETLIEESSLLDVSPSVHHPKRITHLTANAKLAHRMHDASSIESEMEVVEECLNGGMWRSSVGACECPITFGGRRCDEFLCLNGGVLTEDGRSCHCGKFEGRHCEQPACVGGMLSPKGKCECIGNYFGRFCELFCVHGRLLNGRCVCFAGFEGVTCTRCNSSYVRVNAGDCDEVPRRRRPVMQSRFALSGLSLCLITIILLWISVVTRKRRTMMAATHFERIANERLLREQQRRLCDHRAVAVQVPRTSRSRAVCEFRHFVQAARNADVRLLTVACGSRPRTTDANNETFDTPPPEYCASPQEAPPSYEEATRPERVDTLK